MNSRTSIEIKIMKCGENNVMSVYKKDDKLTDTYVTKLNGDQLEKWGILVRKQSVGGRVRVAVWRGSVFQICWWGSSLAEGGRSLDPDWRWWTEHWELGCRRFLYSVAHLFPGAFLVTHVHSCSVTSAAAAGSLHLCLLTIIRRRPLAVVHYSLLGTYHF